MTAVHPDHIPDPLAREESPLTHAQARRLTAKVIKAGDQWFDLLLQTWTLKAWAALKYRSWEEYARGELGMSVRNAYRVIDQALVIQALERAGVDAAGPAVSGRQAQVLKADPVAAAQDVAARVADGVTPAKAVASVVRERSAPPKHQLIDPAPVATPTAEGKPATSGPAGGGRRPKVRSPGRSEGTVIEAKAAPVSKTGAASRVPHPGEVAGLTLLRIDPTVLAANLPRPAAQRLAAELDAWLVGFKAALTVTTRAGTRLAGCAPGKHPKEKQVGRVCEACGDKRAWPV